MLLCYFVRVVAFLSIESGFFGRFGRLLGLPGGKFFLTQSWRRGRLVCPAASYLVFVFIYIFRIRTVTATGANFIGCSGVRIFITTDRIRTFPSVRSRLVGTCTFTAATSNVPALTRTARGLVVEGLTI